MPKLRKLRFATLDDAIADIERLRSGPYECGGSWGLGTICDHLTKTMRVGMDGGVPRLAWPLRKLVWPLARYTLWRGEMVSGAPAPIFVLPTADADDAATIDLCVATLAEARNRVEPIPPYVICDGLSLDDWRRLMVIHAQHHLSFLEPAPGGTNPG